MQSLRLNLDRSPLLERLDVAMHLLAVMCVWLSAIGWPLQLGLTAIVAAHGWRRCSGCGVSRGRQQLVYSEQAGWVLEQQGRAPRPLTIGPGTVVSPWLVLLQGHDGRQCHLRVIARDSLDAESFRCLRVYLCVCPRVPDRPRAGHDAAGERRGAGFR